MISQYKQRCQHADYKKRQYIDLISIHSSVFSISTASDAITFKALSLALKRTMINSSLSVLYLKLVLLIRGSMNTLMCASLQYYTQNKVDT
jgi:hypothetical protein